jgi:hypothetical protein
MSDRWGAVVILRIDRVSSGEELRMICDCFSIIRPSLYSLLPANMVNSGRFNVNTLYIHNMLTA